jgi:hypothetical protein
MPVSFCNDQALRTSVQTIGSLRVSLAIDHDVDETSRARGHDDVALAADALKRQVLFVTKGRDAKTVKELAAYLDDHGCPAGQQSMTYATAAECPRSGGLIPTLLSMVSRDSE